MQLGVPCYVLLISEVFMRRPSLKILKKSSRCPVMFSFGVNSEIILIGSGYGKGSAVAQGRSEDNRRGDKTG